MNNITAIGRLTKDAALGETKSGTAFARFTLAADRNRRTKYGEQPPTDYIPVIIYGRKAEAFGEYLKQGKALAVFGTIQTGSYKNSEGTTVYTWEILGDNKLELLPDGAMTGSNEVVLIGRLVEDVKTSYTKDQTCVCEFTVACDRHDRDRRADFVPVTLYGKLGESLGRYLVKGKMVAVKGRIQTGSYKNSEGTIVHTWKVVTDKTDLLGNGGKKEKPEEAESATEEQTQAEAVGATSDEILLDEESGFIELPDDFDDGYFDEPFWS